MESKKQCSPVSAVSLLRHVLAGDVESGVCVFCLCRESLLSPAHSVAVNVLPSKVETISIQQLVNELCLARDTGDLTSKRICTQCVEKLTNFYVFKRKCLTTVALVTDLVNTLYRETTNTSKSFNNDLFHEENVNIRICIDTLSQIIPALQCRKCYSDFLTLDELSIHQSVHGRSQFYLCRLCDEKFNGFQRLIAHYKTVHPQHSPPTLVVASEPSLQFTCSKCKEVFVNQSNLNSHITHKHAEHKDPELHRSGSEFICNECNLHFEQRTELWKHMFQKHELKSKCNICKRRFQESHRCRYSCSECPNETCLHEKYLKALFRDRYQPKKTCVDCEFVYKDKAALIEHANRCHLFLLPYVCSHCGKKLPSKKALCSHKALYHPSSSCPHCNVNIRKHILEKHIRECENLEKPYGCDLCEGLFASIEQAEAHTRSHVPNVFTCKVCSATHATRRELKYHTAQCHHAPEENSKEKKWAIANTCAKCNLEFLTKEESVAHELSHPPDMQYICPCCRKTFATKAERLECIRTHKVHQTEVCPLCGRLFTKLGLLTHFKVHASRGETEGLPVTKSERRVLPKVFVCDVCGSKHGSSQAVKRHKERHKKQIKCSYCSKLIWPRHLRKHLTLHERGPKPLTKIKLQCKECDFSTHIESVYEGHLNRVHRNVQPYTCEVCNKGFYSKHLHSTHLRSHSGKIRTCEECGKAFRSSRGYVLHTRQHRGEMRFSCEYCDLRFVSSSRLKEHETRAHFEPQYQCSSCDMKFCRMAAMRNHIKTVHKEGKARRRMKLNQPQLQDVFILGD